MVSLSQSRLVAGQLPLRAVQRLFRGCIYGGCVYGGGIVAEYRVYRGRMKIGGRIATVQWSYHGGIEAVLRPMLIYYSPKQLQDTYNWRGKKVLPRGMWRISDLWLKLFFSKFYFFSESKLNKMMRGKFSKTR